MFLIEKIHPLAFLISLCIGLFLTYISTPTPEIIIKYPTPENSEEQIYKDDANNCYKFSSNEVSCPKDNTLIKDIPIQKKKLKK